MGVHSCKPRLGSRKQNGSSWRSLGTQPICGWAGYQPKKKKKVSACQNYPWQILWTAQNVQSTFSGMTYCMFCCNWHPVNLTEIRVLPHVTGGYTYYALGTQKKKMSSGFCSVSIHLQGLFSFIVVMRPLQLLETQMHLFAVVKNARYVKTLRRFIKHSRCSLILNV